MPAASRPRSRVDLDDRSSYQLLDPQGMLGFALDFPDQLKHAAQIGRTFKPPPSLRDPSQVVLSGMGGSAVAGDLLSRLCQGHSPIPILVNRSYGIPRSVDQRTLFIASSYSGNTEETLSAAELALRRRAKIVCITSGGKLRGIALRHGLPLIEIPAHPSLPPRAALGYSLVPLIFLLSSLGLYPGIRRQMRETAHLASCLRDELHPEIATKRNLAKQVACHLHGKIPWVQGATGIMGAAAYRWRCQLNENSKVLACSSEYPELNHNEVVGWEASPALTGLLAVVILCELDAPPHIQARIEITQKLMLQKAPVRLIYAQGDTSLARLLWIIYLGDFASLYLAFLNRVNPAAIQAINQLKSQLAKLRLS